MRFGRSPLSALLVVLAAAGCSFTFDDAAPELPLVGAPPSLSSLTKLNKGPVYGSAIVRGIDNAFWLSLQEESKKLRVQRLSEPAAETTLEGDSFVIAWRSFFVWQASPGPTDPMKAQPATLSLISAGQDPKDAQRFDFAFGIGQLILGGQDDVFAYIPPASASATSYELVTRKGSYRRAVPMPGAPEKPSLSGAFFTGDASYFFDRAPCSEGCATDASDSDRGGTERRTLVAHATAEEVDLDFGLLPRRVYMYEPSVSKRMFITCGSDGLRVVPFAASDANPPRVLDADACATDIFTLQRVAADDNAVEAFYNIGGALRRVRLDGAAPPVRVLDRDVERVLAIYDPGLIIYSQDSADRYIYGVGDGWIGDWRFMNRGRAADLSNDRKRIRFLENAAQAGGIGDLSAGDIGGPIERLARNVYQYDELADGRVLAAANHAFRGTQNRVVLIDEVRKEATWVVDQASRYSFIPGSTDLLVDIVTGASSVDLVRVPLPPAPARAP